MGQIEVQIHWRTGTVTSQIVKRTAPGEGSLKTPQEAVSQIHKMAPRRSYAEIAASLNRSGLRSAFGRRFTTARGLYLQAGRAGQTQAGFCIQIERQTGRF
jgi:hypothetical protein